MIWAVEVWGEAGRKSSSFGLLGIWQSSTHKKSERSFEKEKVLGSASNTQTHLVVIKKKKNQVALKEHIQ